MNVSSHYWSPFHANDCVFSRNEQQKVYIRELTQKGGGKKMSANKRQRVITGEFCRDLHFQYCVLSSYETEMCLEEGEVWRKIFFNKIIVTLSFGFLLRKFTISELTIFFGCAHKGFTRQRWTRNSNYRTAGARTKFKTYLLKTNFCVLFSHWYRTTEELTSLSFWD